MTSKHQFAGKYGRVKLSEIARIKAGNVAPKKDAFTKDGVSFVRAGSLAKLLAGESLDSLEKIDVRTARELRLTLFPKGTVVFAKSGMSCMTGNVYVLPDPCYVVSHLACVIPNGNYTAYLKHYFRFKRPNRLIENPSFPSIKLEKIRDIELCLPSSEVIDKQVQTLEHIEDQIKQMKAQLLHFEYLVKSRFVEMFGYIGEGTFIYPPKRIEDLCLEIIGGGTPSMKHPEYYGGSIPFIKSGDVKSQVVTNGNLSITKEGLKRSSAKLAPMHSILVVTRSGILKHTLPIAIAGCSVAINQDLKALVLNESVIPEYIQWSLLVSKQLILSKVRATTADNIETSLLKNFMVPVPPLQLQHEFADFAAQVDKLKFDFDFLVSFSIPSICLFCLKLDP